METGFSLMYLLICIHQTSASAVQSNTTFSTPGPGSLSPSLLSSSSPSSSSPLIATTMNSTMGASISTIPSLIPKSLMPNTPSMQSPTYWSSTSIPSLTTPSLGIFPQSSTERLSSAMMTSLYEEYIYSSMSIEISDLYILTTEEIWLSTLVPVIASASAPAFPPPNSSHSNTNHPPFPTPSQVQTSSGAMTEEAHESISSEYLLLSTTPLLSASSLVETSEYVEGSRLYSSSTMTSNALNASMGISSTQSLLHVPDVTTSAFHSTMTSIIYSHSMFKTETVYEEISVTSTEQTERSSYLNTTLLPSTNESNILSSRVHLSLSTGDNITVFSPTLILSTSTAATVSHSVSPDTPQITATFHEDTTLTLDYIPVRCTMVLGGNCTKVRQTEDTFKKNFTKTISALLVMDARRISVNEVKCGSVVVVFTLEDTPDGEFAEKLFVFMDTRNITVPFGDQNMIAEDIVFHNGPYAGTTPSSPRDDHPKDEGNPPVSNDGGGGLTFEQQQKLIYILIGVVVGFVILLSIVLVVHHIMRKTCSKSTQSFDLQDEPCIKLTDFNMAHTCIPRPRSIYSSIGADGRFFRYDTREDVGNPPSSPTSFIYADSRDIKEHYHDVIDPETHHDPLTSTMQNHPDFGQSGLPEWNLPLVDGATPISPDRLAKMDSHHSSHPSTSSDTFRPPSTASSVVNNQPVFSPPAPPAPPPPPLPTPIIQSGTLRSRQSCDASSEMTDSSSDTNTLTKGSSDGGTSMMGIDNPLMTPEEDYDMPGPSSSGRIANYIVR